MDTMANSEQPDEMQHMHDKAAFHQGMHCLFKDKMDHQRKKYD